MMELRRKKVSVLGCGWLGLPLAANLAEDGFLTKGSTTSSEKLRVIEEKGVEPWLINAGNIPDENKVSPFFNSFHLVITLPPSDKALYPGQVKQILSLAEKYGTERVILISSTSVYPSSDKTFDETSDDIPDSDAGKVIKEAEEYCLNYTSLSTVVLRFGGLIGPGRNPGRFFAGRKDIPAGGNPVNLIALDDCIGIIRKLIDKREVTGVFNGVCDEHPSRAEFYTFAAEVSGLPLPLFKDEVKNYKIISNKKVKSELGYEFIYKNPIDWLKRNK